MPELVFMSWWRYHQILSVSVSRAWWGLGISFLQEMSHVCPHFLKHLLFLLQYKLCKVKKILIGTKGIPHLVTHDARTIRYPDPLIKVNDTVRIDLESSKITDFIKFDTGTFNSLHNLLACFLLMKNISDRWSSSSSR